MFDFDNYEKFTKGEEIANSIIHGIGILFSLAALVLMIVFSSIKGDPWKIVSTTIFGSTLLIMYTSSTLYHALTNRKAKHIFEIFDHISIYLLIAGTYTPYTLVTLRGPLGWTIFGIVWGMAVLGILFKIFFLKKHVMLSTFIYILMGWMIIIGIKQIFLNLPFWGFIWLVIGGILYTIGTIFYIWRKFKYHHAVWHIFVLFGSFSHFISIFFYIIF
ncbi:hemolysin III family protein [Oceanotoga sp. DSM 15011]|jgi:hemolysin III|uniref:PAQR family membrane homeostasis protein TrhA n=1 Tax=Oceanotoga TaxID=1255275 RepID=UPI0021F4D1E5|nr:MULTISPECIES: hemolysin III family protein [Oceanotoga]MDO7976890.1 hemolysin III family protein [Oceanotoga teriensis]UYP00807.1 hemolysin III family protein [Oceanotoga sp. DSM 15011]